MDGLDSRSDESSSFLNKNTSEVVLISDYEMRAAEEDDPTEDFPDWEQDLVRIAREVVAETGEYVGLPRPCVASLLLICLLLFVQQETIR